MSSDPTIRATPPKDMAEAPMAVGQGGESPPLADEFTRLMQQPTGPGATATSSIPNAETVFQRPVIKEPATAESVKQQALQTRSQMDHLQNLLQDPRLKIDPSNPQTSKLRLSRADQKLLEAKLPIAHEKVRSASKTLGIDSGPKLQPSKDTSLLQKALMFLSDGQAKLNTIATVSNELGKSSNVSPSTYMQAQVKINAASQEVQFCTTSISKILDALKTIVNMQI